MANEFKEFTTALEQYGFNIDESQLTDEEKSFIGSVFTSVKEFLTTNQLVPGEMLGAVESLDKPITELSNEVSLTDIGLDPIIDLCKQANIPNEKLKEATACVALTICQYRDGSIKNAHFDNSTSMENFDKNVQMKTLDGMFSSAALASNTMTISDSWNHAVESFGITMDKTFLDAKLAITVSVLQFHKSILSRLLPVRPVDGEVVTFKVDRYELYDLAKASSKSATERYGSHRTPFVEIYGDPTPANTSPKKIVPLTANDSGNKYLLADGIVKLDVEANLFDLSMLSDVIGFDKVDYTDLVSEGGKVECIVVEVTDGTDTEQFKIPVSHLAGARFTFPTNAAESSQRITNLDGKSALDDSAVTLAGSNTSLLSFLNDDNHFAKLDFTLNGKIDLRSSYVKETGALTATLATKDGTTPLTAMANSFNNLTFKLVGYCPDVYFSPENLRKISTAARIMTSIAAYPIPGSKTVAVDYSITQTTPETVINALTQLLSVGNDDRGIKLILDNLEYVNTRLTEEKAFPLATNYTEKVMSEFVAGNKVKPAIYINSININSTTTSMRTGDRWGDIRTNIEKYLVEIITKLMNESYYYTQLAPGEKVTFNVLTSGFIKDALLAVPFYHTRLEEGTQNAPDDVVDFRRILPNNAVLNVITTNFNYMTDKILMVPVRPTQPASDINYGQVADKGNFVATLTAYSGSSSAFKRVIANRREIPIITCPVAALITVQGLSSVFSNNGSLGV